MYYYNNKNLLLSDAVLSGQSIPKGKGFSSRCASTVVLESLRCCSTCICHVLRGFDELWLFMASKLSSQIELEAPELICVVLFGHR